MQLFRGLFHSRDKPDNPTNSLNGNAFSFFFGNTSSGKSVNERSAMQMTAVYACVRILSEAVAGLPLHIYRYTDRGKEKAVTHPLYHVLHDEPNPEMTSFIFRETLMSHLLLWGNAYKDDIAKGRKCADCIGLVKGYYWMREDGTSKYGLDGRPDKGANGMFTAAKVKGTIDTLPEVPGLLLYSPGHAGVYIGGGYAIEARGFAYGIVKTLVSSRSWTHWYQCPYIDYDGMGVEIPIAPRSLKYTAGASYMTGNDVLEVQTALIACGYDPGAADKKYGPKTEAAVRLFQKDNNLEVDGVVGSTTRQALEAARKKAETQGEAAENKPAENAPPPGENTPGTATPARLLTYKKGRKMLSGEDVRAVQIRLDALGFPPGKIDGIYGPLTAAAVTAFQQSRNIKVDGIVGPETRTHLAV